MVDIQIKRNIRFVTVEKPNAWLVLAVLVEIRDGLTVAVSEPKIVKIIQKKFAALSGNVQKRKISQLSAPKILVNQSHARHGIISPYSTSFKYLDSHTIPWFSAQPPTF